MAKKTVKKVSMGKRLDQLDDLVGKLAYHVAGLIGKLKEMEQEKMDKERAEEVKSEVKQQQGSCCHSHFHSVYACMTEGVYRGRGYCNSCNKWFEFKGRLAKKAYKLQEAFKKELNK